MSALPGLLLPWLRQFWSCGAIGVLGLLAWHFDARAVANADAVRTQAAQFKQAQADATRIAQQALEHEDLVYRQKAQEADSAYQAQLADASAAADRYIAAHRVQPRPLRVVPAAPLPPPTVTVPRFLRACPPTPSWYPAQMCKPAPTR